jgi:hypothetical protein
VEDLKATLEKLLTDAEDCAVIGKLATDEKKRAGPDSGSKKPPPG